MVIVKQSRFVQSIFSGSWVGMGRDTKECALDVLSTDRGLLLGMLYSFKSGRDLVPTYKGKIPCTL